MLDNLNMRASSMMGYLRTQKTSEVYNAFLKREPSLEDILKHDGTVQEILQANINLIS
jgi:hypothetical protein